MVKNSQETGQTGEAIAEGYLLSQGYTIRESNYRYQRTEIDLIAARGESLFFIEVKTRRGFDHGTPASALSPEQEKRLARAAANYMREQHFEWAFRFDIIAILLYKDGSYDLEHIEDAFFPGLF